MMYVVVTALHNCASDLRSEDAYLNLSAADCAYCGIPQFVREHVGVIDCPK